METKIKSITEFIQEIIKKTSASNDSDSQLFWFRGEASNQYETPLVPGSYRTIAATFKDKMDEPFNSETIRELENNINAEFNRRAQRYISPRGIENSKWNRYFLMQHYNINTRLLDWTENAILALFFAITDNSSINNDAKVWILQPFKLNDYTIKKLIDTDKSCMIIPPAEDSKEKQKLKSNTGGLNLGELTRRYLQMDFESESESKNNTYYPLAIYPTFLDERMTSQKTCFTIFGNKVNGLLSNDNSSEFLDYVTIEGGKSKRKILKEIRMLGIDYESIYPDLDGIGLSIKEEYNKYFSEDIESKLHLFKCLFDKSNNDK